MFYFKCPHTGTGRNRLLIRENNFYTIHCCCPRQCSQTTFLTDIAAERQIYDELENLSDGKISVDSHSEYQIQKIEVLGQYPDPKIGQVVAVRATSFFIPPMGAIKTDLECRYQVGYILKKDDQLIRKKVLDVFIKG